MKPLPTKHLLLLLLVTLALAAAACSGGSGDATYTLTIEKDGEGTVTPDLGEHPYRQLSAAGIAADPAPGWEFEEWQGEAAAPDSPSTTVYMDRDKTVTAVFAPTHGSLAIAIDGQGSVEQESVLEASSQYPLGSVVRITAVPDSGWKFEHWSGDIGGSDNPKDIEILSETHITAVFTQPASDGEPESDDGGPNDEADDGSPEDHGDDGTEEEEEEEKPEPEPETDSAAIQGTVYLDQSNVPLAGAVVTEAGSGQTVTTGEDGFYSFNQLPAGERSITAAALYNDAAVTVSTSEGNLTEKDIHVPFDQISFEYFDHLVQQIDGFPDGTRRWPLGTDIAVYLDADNTPTGYTAGHKDTTWHAIQQWAEAIGNQQLSVHITDTRQNADVVVEWWAEEDFPAAGIVGMCMYSWNGNWEITYAEIAIDVQYEGELLQAIAFHEFGHALRLGHSPLTSDVMYWSMQPGVVGPSPMETEAARVLYSIPTQMYLQPADPEGLLGAQNVGGPGTKVEYTTFSPPAKGPAMAEGRSEPQ